MEKIKRFFNKEKIVSTLKNGYEYVKNMNSNQWIAISIFLLMFVILKLYWLIFMTGVGLYAVVKHYEK